MNLPTTEVTEIPPEAVLLDVREPAEWAAGHIAAAVHIPMGQIPDRLAEVPTDTPIAVVCRVGARSGRVTAFLRQAGRDAYNVSGGMQAWAAAGQPMVSETGAAPEVI